MQAKHKHTHSEERNSNTGMPVLWDFPVSKMVDSLSKSTSIENALHRFVRCFVQAWAGEFPLGMKAEFNSVVYHNKVFQEEILSLEWDYYTPDRKYGRIEIHPAHPNDQRYQELISRIGADMEQVLPVLKGILAAFQLEKLVAYNTEREKELKGINLTAEILGKAETLDESLQNICSHLPEAMQFPAQTAVRIVYEGRSYTSKGFRETPWMLRQTFETPDQKKGCIEIVYLKKFPEADEGPFLAEERNLINNLAALISGTVSKKALQDLLVKNTERLKELKGINSTSEILKTGVSMEDSLRQICAILPASWQYVDDTVARITYDKWVFQSENFRETPWRMVQQFETAKKKTGTIEICYLREFPLADEGPFLNEERSLLINLANLIAGRATKDIFQKLQHENAERLKELRAINLTSRIIENGNSIGETLQEICNILPRSWQYPKHTVTRIRFEGKEYYSRADFRETVWGQKENFVTIDNKKGSVEIYYLKPFPTEDEGPFLTEERNLLINICKLISGYLNNYKGREMYNKNLFVPLPGHKSDEFRNSLIRNKKPLQLYFNQQSIDKYVYLDMMKYKVKHILFVATLYDAFMLESEDSFFEKFMGEIYQYSLFSLPRITGVSSAEEALELLETAQFDMVILMVGIDRVAPIALSEKIREKKENLPIYLLLNKKSDVSYFEELVPTIRSVDKIFVWNGDSLIFFAIVKSTEDKINVENDTKIGLVRVILLIEDSPLYYSRYLQILYSIVFGQVQQLLPEVEKNELDKICKMRSRPKILLARNYDEALVIFNKYKDFLLCVISDVAFERAGKMDKTAGVKFIRYAKSHIIDLPVILQSSDETNAKLARKLDVRFLNKNSETLLIDIKKYLTSYLGFGNFTFRDKEGNKIAVAKSLRDFETLLKEIPDDSFHLHASENQFSLWLMARGEIQLAKTLNPVNVDQFSDLKESRQFFIDTIRRYKEEKKRGKILRFDETSTLDEKNIVSFSGGSLGGKGRGLAFVNTLINNVDFSGLSHQINIISPITVIIGTDEFHGFITRNKLMPLILDPHLSYEELRRNFADGSLSHSLEMKLKDFVTQIDKPFAVRSSSTSEDSLTQPFAGVFDTFIVPNSEYNKRIVFERISLAIKLVYASVYSDKARNYFKAIHHKIEEEKMAIILQELVGSAHGSYYYPHISGVAQSYNYYPVGHMQPEEGFAVAAVGLGTYVVDGWKSYRFSPVYPQLSMFSVRDLLNSTQVKFFALDCESESVDFLKDGEMASLRLLDISEAEKHGTLNHCASVYIPDNDRVEPGLSKPGPRVVNFANILQYNYIPLAETINVLLNTIKDAFGSPVEIEWAVDLERKKNNLPSFYLLQIKPLVGTPLNQQINIDRLNRSDMILHTRSSLGNGQITDLTDVIFVDNERFSKLKTMEMVNEIEYLNNLMVNEDRYYILIGPGRWGTRDRFIGIPVVWSQISNAKVIVEISLDNYPLDSSLGSHFFHNVTSMNIGYFSVQHNAHADFVRWNELEKQQVINRTHFFKHVRFSSPLKIFMDGIHRRSAILTRLNDD
ncbi:MAG TPA: PEP/pyruvate-binding domain-containing protein [Prolixibacteraceae bacterium]|nr:PEP/pyruvate-binding domain-containing protein [Prolixibacteraceae bacterium]